MKIEFSAEDPLASHYPPVPAKKLIPDWYKDMPVHGDSEQQIHDAEYLVVNDIISTKTIKGCLPVLDYLSSGYIIRSHTQILITPKIMHDPMINSTVKTFWWKARKSTFVPSHAHAQCPISIDGQKNSYLKYPNPWKVTVPAGYSCLFYQPEYLLESRYRLFPAIVDCDKFDSPVLFPGYITSKESFYINPGDPIMAVFPFKRDSWKMEVTESSKKVSKLESFFIDGYKILFHSKKSYK